MYLGQARTRLSPNSTTRRKSSFLTLSIGSQSAREHWEQFYSLLHRAVDTGNDQQLETALNGILGIIQENPLKDFAEFKKNMADPNFMLEL